MAYIYQCPRIVNLLVDYLEGDLDKAQRDDLELHLEICPACLAFIESYKSTGPVCKTILQKEMPSELKTALSDFLADKLNPPSGAS